MNITSMGDLAQSFTLRRNSAEIRQNLDRLTDELSSGTARDVAGHLDGSLDRLAHTERNLVIMQSQRIAGETALADMATMQSSLDRIRSLGEELTGDAVLAGATPGGISLAVLGNNARATLEGVVSALNAANAGRALFAGADVDGVALAPAEDILSGARAAVAGASGAAEVLAGLESYFGDAGGPFETDIYQGGTSGAIAYHLGDGGPITPGVRADDPAFRDVFLHVVAAALVDDPTLGFDAPERLALSRAAAGGLLAASQEVTLLQAGLGSQEARAEQASVRLEAEVSSLRIARQELLGVDQFQTASDLEAAQTQLETIFAITARSARLSLVNFL